MTPTKTNPTPPPWETLEAVDVEPTWATPKLMYPKILVDAALTALRAQLEQVTRQRDEARAGLAALRADIRAEYEWRNTEPGCR